MFSREQFLAVIPLLAFCATSALGQAQQPDHEPGGRKSVAGRLATSIQEPGLRSLVAEVLERNPGVSATAARTGVRGDGIVFVPPVDQAVQFLTRAKGPDALDKEGDIS